MADAIQIVAGRRFAGSLRMPPSKSVTNRYLNLALLAGRELVLERPLEADDTAAMLAALRALGWRARRHRELLELRPGERIGEAAIDCGASGTMARFFTATLAALPGSWRLDGSPRLRRRPLAPLLAALRRLGARIECEGREGYLPLRLEGGRLRGGELTVDSRVSSQFLSALLMASTRAEAPVEIVAEGLVSEPYAALTVDAVRAFGGRAIVLPRAPGRAAWRVEPGLRPAGRYRIEGDYSAACYFAAAAALAGGRVELEGLPRASRQGDRGFLDLLGRMGAKVDWRGSDRLEVSAAERLSGIDVDMSGIPDQVPTLAALAPFAAGQTTIRNVAHLRIKESDRLAACATELGRLGAAAEELDDGLVVRGSWAGSPSPAEPVVVATYDDHRIAMSFAVLGLRRAGVRIDEPGVVAKSYPGFWEDFERCLTS